MKISIYISGLLAAIFIFACGLRKTSEMTYTKNEYQIQMRDGKTLFTAVYAPSDTSRDYPILITAHLTQ